MSQFLAFLQGEKCLCLNCEDGNAHKNNKNVDPRP